MKLSCLLIECGLLCLKCLVWIGLCLGQLKIYLFNGIGAVILFGARSMEVSSACYLLEALVGKE
jgi:hypothetical protein